MELLTLSEITHLLPVRRSESTNIPERKPEKPGKPKPPLRNRKHVAKQMKSAYPLTVQKYYTIPGCWQLLLSMTQPLPSPSSPNTLTLPTRLSPAPEPYRIYYTLTTSHTSAFNKHLLTEDSLFVCVCPSLIPFLYFEPYN